MPNRVLPYENKYKPAMTFVINLPLRFSISTNLDKEQIKKFNFQFTLANRNMNMSVLLRAFILKRLKIKNDKELELFFEKELKLCKEKVYKNMKVNRENSFSSIMIKDINDFIKEENEK